MPDIPMWIVDLKVARTKLGKRVTSCVRQIVLRCLLEQIPGLVDDAFKEYAETVRDALQERQETVSGTASELNWLANTVSVHFSLEHMEQKSDQSRDRVEAASYWASKVYKHVRDAPADSFRKAPSPPARLVAKSLFGDDE